MDDNCARPCRELKELEGSFDRFREETDQKYDRELVSFPCAYTHPGFHRETTKKLRLSSLPWTGR